MKIEYAPKSFERILKDNHTDATKSGSDQNETFDLLSDEMVLRVFSNLPNDQRVTVAKVSERFKRLIHDINLREMPMSHYANLLANPLNPFAIDIPEGAYPQPVDTAPQNPNRPFGSGIDLSRFFVKKK